MPPENAVALLETAEPVIRGIVRAKLRASLRPDDGREHNQDAIDLLGDIRLKLIRGIGENVGSVTSYAATTAYNACSDYLRAKYPQRTRLKNALRRLMEKSPGMAVWQLNDWVCGYAGWRHMEPAAIERVAPPPPPVHADSPAGLLRLVSHVLDAAQAPVHLDDLVAWVASCAGIQDLPANALEEDEGRGVLDTAASPAPGAESWWLAAERMRLLWGAIRQLLPWHRAAYLLNLRDGELDAFVYYGAASIDDIGAALEMKPEQAVRLARALGIDMSLTAQVQFAACWKHFPVDDNLLAEVLQVTRPQIIAYRNKAIERLRRMLKDLR
jgi:DNA-directed RNA polymerase specialized sigma24 family protein